MKIQKIFVEVYVEDGFDVCKWIRDELIESDRISYRNVHLINEEDVSITYPEQYKEDIMVATRNIDDFIAEREKDEYDHDLGSLKNISDELKRLLLCNTE